MNELSEILKLVTNENVKLEDTDLFDLVSLPSDDESIPFEISSASSNEDLKLQNVANISDDDGDVSDDMETVELPNWENIYHQEIREDLKAIKEKLKLLNDNMESAAELLKLNGHQMEIKFKNIENELNQLRQGMVEDNDVTNKYGCRKPTDSYLNLVSSEYSGSPLFNKNVIRVLFIILVLLSVLLAVIYCFPSIKCVFNFSPNEPAMINGKVNRGLQFPV